MPLSSPRRRPSPRGATPRPSSARSPSSASSSSSRSTSKRSPERSRPSTARRIDESRGSVRRGIECVEVACGSPSLMMGYGLENVALGNRLRGHPAAGRRLRRDRAVQLPGDGAAVVPPVRGRVPATRSSLKPSEQVPLSQRADVPSCSRSATSRRASSTSSTAGARSWRRSAITPRSARCRSSDRPRSPGAVYQRGDPRRQARAGARRREELHRRHAGRRLGPLDRRDHRVVLRLRRRALPRGQRAGAGRRGAQGGAGPDWSRPRGRSRSATDSRPGVDDGTRHQRPPPRARRSSYIEKGVGGGREAPRSTAAT